MPETDESPQKPRLTSALSEISEYAAKYSVPFGLAGALYGMGAATYREQPVAVPATAIGLNCFFAAFGVLAFERTITRNTSIQSGYLSYGLGGALAGVSAHFIHRGGLSAAPPRIFALTAIGIGLNITFDVWEMLKNYWRRERVKQLVKLKLNDGKQSEKSKYWGMFDPKRDEMNRRSDEKK